MNANALSYFSVHPRITYTYLVRRVCLFVCAKGVQTIEEGIEIEEVVNDCFFSTLSRSSGYDPHTLLLVFTPSLAVAIPCNTPWEIRDEQYISSFE